MKCSQAAIDLIWREETGPDGYYVRSNECRADWPGGASGVTIGGFYDLGYVSETELKRDWGDKLPASMIETLESVVGIHGRPAQSHAHELDHIVNVPEDVARDVFLTRELPKWEAAVNRLPNAEKLPADSFGALVSIAMNRGDEFGTSPARDPIGRYREMYLIRVDMLDGRFDAIPDLIRRMKRLWPGNMDLQQRREHEAALFAQGLQTAVEAKQEEDHGKHAS
jgi:hypothetical protein